MKAVIATAFGSPDVLELQEVPAPLPGAGEVLVRVKAAGVNFADTVIRAGNTPDLPIRPPFTPGSEVAGVVEAIGKNVGGLSVGERVVAPLYLTGGLIGGYAELVVARSDAVVVLPDDIGFDTASALALQGLTALQLLRSRPIKDRKVLVTAAAGGTGSQLAQIAKALGARLVVGVAGGKEKVARVNELGIDAAVDYRASDWSAAVRAATGPGGPDLIIDAVGASLRPILLELLAPQGTIIIYGASEGAEAGLTAQDIGGLIGKAQSVAGFSLWPQLGDLSFLDEAFHLLFDLVRSGALTPKISSKFPLREAAEAHRALVARETVGKLVLFPETSAGADVVDELTAR